MNSGSTDRTAEGGAVSMGRDQLQRRNTVVFCLETRDRNRVRLQPPDAAEADRAATRSVYLCPV